MSRDREITFHISTDKEGYKCLTMYDGEHGKAEGNKADNLLAILLIISKKLNEHFIQGEPWKS